MDLVSRRNNFHKQGGTKAGYAVTWPSINPSLQIRTYDAEDVFKFLDSNYEDLMVDRLLEIRKPRDFEEAEESAWS